MKNFLIFLLILGVIGFLVKSHKSDTGSADDSGPITNPTYAEVRFQISGGDRTLHIVVVGKGRDDADCNRMISDLPERVGSRGQGGASEWTIESSGCKKTIDARTARLFDNKPTFVNYISASPGVPEERETRMIVWGMTDREGEIVCNLVPHVKERWQGNVTCVRAAVSQ